MFIPSKVKRLVAGVIRVLSLHLPPGLAVLVLNRSWSCRRPVLDYLEFHLADHCNLNCAGCFHYSPFAPQRFASLASIDRDFSRLAEIFSNIRKIRIMGGEPFLHPGAGKAVEAVRRSFPNSNVRIVTNGLNLAAGTDGFASAILEKLRRYNVGLDWTLYPPLEGKEGFVKALCGRYGVDLRITRNGTFQARLLPTGNGKIKKSFAWCRKRLYCPLLDDGRIYLCAPARYSGYYNKAAGTRIPPEGGIDIHSATAREIMLYLANPSFACAWCADGCRKFAWKAGGSPEDWLK